MLISVALASIMLAGVLWFTQWFTSRTGVRSDHPAMQYEEPRPPTEKEAAYMMLPTQSVDLNGQAKRDPMFEIDALAERMRTPGGS